MEKEEDGRGGDGSISSIFCTVTKIETHVEGELKASREFSGVEKLLVEIATAEENPFLDPKMVKCTQSSHPWPCRNDG